MDIKKLKKVTVEKPQDTFNFQRIQNYYSHFAICELNKNNVFLKIMFL